ncbi:MAG: hypothetical protein NTU94_14575 [Planctomycetota bacterium]|nr:hypothetical protein [Planctomycetota bacterium]
MGKKHRWGEEGTMGNSYSHLLHRHNFAVWAAARASQRRWGSAKTALIKTAVEASGLPETVADTASWPADKEAFDTFHRHHCHRIMQRLEADGVQTVTYGRAAKIVAIYLKSMVVVGPDWDTQFARLIHPPIDNMLLKNIVRGNGVPGEVRQACKGVKWTVLPEASYFRLIAVFRQHGMDKPAFWMLERYWKVTPD